MYLKALEIQGFKSFPDKTVLTFGEDITAIVGPNGSGKSNISDAIRWVMGEQSTRALRGGKMEDVIFGGTAKRRQTGYAEVSLRLDNTSRMLEMDESEVMITRRYYRSGESEYYINRRSVRLKDINELFMDTGLGREGYAIIGQGRIDEILSVRSTDRREIFEEAAGISRFRHRKEEACRKLEHTDENLVRINDKIAELELQVEPLRQQSETAKRYLLLRDELRGLEISVWLDALEHIRSSKIKLDTDYQEMLRQKKEVRSAQEQAFAAAEEYAAQMRSRDVQADAQRQEMQVRQNEVGELEASIAVLRRDIQHNLESMQRLQGEFVQQEGRENALHDQIRQRRTRLEAIQTKLTRQRQEKSALHSQVQEIMQRVGVLTRELEQLRRREDLESVDVSQAKALLSALTAAAQEILARDEALRGEMCEREQRIQELAQELQTLEQSLRQAREERDSAGNVLQGYTLRLESRQKRVEQQQQQHTQLQMEEHTLTSRIKLLTEMEQLHEGYSKAVKLVMNEVQRGVLHHIHGPVADLLKVSETYTVAVEIALGAAMQYLVVDREDDGKAVIQYLKRRDGGRVTILPLSAIRPSSLRERQSLTQEPGFVGIGDALVSFDAQYRDIFSNLLGRVVVMENLECAIAAARKYRYQFRIVTLDGQVLNPGGSMTGGSASRSAGILSRANELERLKQQQLALRERSAQAARLLAERQREAAAARYELGEAQLQLRRWEDEILTIQAQLTGAVQREAELRQRHEGQCAELTQLEQRAGQIEQDTRTVQSRIEALEGAAAVRKSEAEGKTQGQQTLQERSEQLTQALAQCSASVAALEAEQNAMQSGLEELEQLLASLAGDRNQSREMLLDYEVQNEAINRRIQTTEQKLAGVRQEIQQREQQIFDLNQEKLGLEGQRIQASRESQSRYEELSRLEQEVSRLEQQRTSVIMEERQLLDKLWENYELSHEAARKQCLEIESVARANRRISELKRDISRLGSVNLGAVEEFERVNERYTYLTEQRDDIVQARKELEGIIGGITAEMKKIFSREFQTINTAFMETFQELFGGGKATLELENPNDILNCGIEIKVQPPGKALKSISLLSGGEKAFVAIALYFAILKVRPTPFVVMDEIEAALDDNNVVRFARYMRKMSQRTQFIVITHRRGTMEEADVLYGVTMQEQGISRMLTIHLHEVEQRLQLKH